MTPTSTPPQPTSPHLPTRSIASTCGVSNHLVAEVREEEQKAGRLAVGVSPTRVDSTGRTQPASKPKRDKTPEPTKDPPAPSGPTQAEINVQVQAAVETALAAERKAEDDRTKARRTNDAEQWRKREAELLRTRRYGRRKDRKPWHRHEALVLHECLAEVILDNLHGAARISVKGSVMHAENGILQRLISLK